MIISTLSSAGGSLGIFRQKWLNWISAQTQCLNGFMDGINWAAAKESHIRFWALEFRSALSLPLIGSLLIYSVNEILKKNKFTAIKLGNILRKQNHHLVLAQFHYYNLYLRFYVDAHGLAWAQLWRDPWDLLNLNLGVDSGPYGTGYCRVLDSCSQHYSYNYRRESLLDDKYLIGVILFRAFCMPSHMDTSLSLPGSSSCLGSCVNGEFVIIKAWFP